jgi:hypothetical protein
MPRRGHGKVYKSLQIDFVYRVAGGMAYGYTVTMAKRYIQVSAYHENVIFW